MKISYDRRNAEEMVHKLLDAYENKRYIFWNLSEPPEVRLSKGMDMGKKHALALFYTIALDSLRQSEYVYQAGRRLAEEVSQDDLASMGHEQIRDVMDVVMDNGIGDPAMIIMKAAQKLKGEYSSDPRNIFKGVSPEGARRRLEMFYGISDGKSALMLKNFQRFGYTGYHEYEMPLKIDRHALRQSIGNGAINIEVDEPTDIRISRLKRLSGTSLEGIFHDICMEERLDAVSLDDAKWFIGAKVCTTKSRLDCGELCPLECSMLVRSNKSGSYLRYPSEVRPDINPDFMYKQQRLF